MSERPAELVSSIVAEVYHLSNLFRRWGEIVAGTIGETQSRWQVLSAASDGDKTVAQISRRLGVTRQNVQRVADDLVSGKLAQMVRNPAHRSSPLVQLTPAGRRKFDQLTRVASKFNAQLAEGLDLNDLRSTQIVLTKLRGQTDRDVTWPEEYMRNM